MELKRLFAPITINGMELKNRLVMPALHHLYTPGGFANDRFNQYYWKRAEGGVGLIIVGGCRFDDYGYSKEMMSLRSDEFIPGYKEFTQGVHERGSKVAVQLYHSGRYAKQGNLDGGNSAIAPSEVYSTYTKETPKEITVEQMKEVAINWANAAIRAKKAGFDAVEILASAGYLLSEFLSPYTNKRNDEYGGCWENRCRFPLEVIRCVREAVGKDYPVIIRIAGNDFMEGGNTNSDAVRFGQLIEEYVDFIDVTGGWHESPVPQITGELPRAGYTYLASAIKNAVKIPVMASNRLNDPIVAEEVLALERSDLIGVGRTLIADPEWCNKAKDGKFNEIRRCVACNQGCLANTFFGRSIECLVNGYAGKEYLFEGIKVKKFKHLLVVGSGPAGCEFAIKASELGHKVTLWERDNHIGGQLNMVAVPPSKSEFINLIKYYKEMLDKYKVIIVLNKEATKENIVKEKFDEIVIATGADPKIIDLPEFNDDMCVVTSSDILEQKVIAGKNVVVIGGGSVGCETSQYLLHKGSLSPEQLYFLLSQKAESIEIITQLLNNSDRNVSIVEVQQKIGLGFAAGTAWPVLKDLKRLGAKIYSSSKIIAVKNGEVVVDKTDENGNHKIIDIPCDMVVLAVGSTPNNCLYNDLKETFSNVHIIGDSKKVGNVLDAIHDADVLVTTI